MVEKLYRGKRIDNGEWVYGFLYETENAESYILKKERLTINYKCMEGITTHVTFIQVDPSTVGQCVSNLPDKNGKKIFEGDIVSTPKYNGVVIYGTGCYCIKHGNNSPAIDIVMNEFDVYVIGNIHDNPELLEDNP
nr:YopX family protein [uncultured Ruminococcus sp.]